MRANKFAQSTEAFNNEGDAFKSRDVTSGKRWPAAPVDAKDSRIWRDAAIDVKGVELGALNAEGLPRSKQSVRLFFKEYLTVMMHITFAQFGYTEKGVLRGEQTQGAAGAGPRQRRENEWRRVVPLFRADPTGVGGSPHGAPPLERGGAQRSQLDAMRAFYERASCYFLGQGALTPENKRRMEALYMSDPTLKFADWIEFLVDRAADMAALKAFTAFLCGRRVNKEGLVHWLAGRQQVVGDALDFQFEGAVCCCCNDVGCVDWPPGINECGKAFKRLNLDIALKQTSDQERRDLEVHSLGVDEYDRLEIAELLETAQKQTQRGERASTYKMAFGKEMASALPRTRKQWQEDNNGGAAIEPAKVPKGSSATPNKEQGKECRRWAADGTCTFGPKCRYVDSHTAKEATVPKETGAQERRVGQCYDFANGKCRRGDACRFSHEDGSDAQKGRKAGEKPRQSKVSLALQHKLMLMKTEGLAAWIKKNEDAGNCGRCGLWGHTREECEVKTGVPELPFESKALQHMRLFAIHY